MLKRFNAGDKVGNEDYTKYSSKELIDHIVNTHHKYLWEEMPKLSKLTLKILSVHGDKHPDLLEKVKSLYENLRKELEDHLKKEEEVLFPSMEAYEEAKEDKEKQDMLEGITSLKDEHENVGNILRKLRETTKDYTVPDDVCGTFAMTFMKLQEMERDIFTHINLENSILFKRYEE